MVLAEFPVPEDSELHATVVRSREEALTALRANHQRPPASDESAESPES